MGTRFLTDEEQADIDRLSDKIDMLNNEQRRHLIDYLEAVIEASPQDEDES